MTSPEGEPANGLSGSSSNSAERLLCLTLNTLSLSTSLRTLDKEVEATMRHFTIEDCARALSHPSLAEGNPYLLSSLPSSEGEPVLTVALNMFDSASPRFQGTHMDVDASLSGLTLSYFGESLAYIISALLLSLRQSTRQHRKLIAHRLCSPSPPVCHYESMWHLIVFRFCLSLFFGGEYVWMGMFICTCSDVGCLLKV